MQLQNITKISRLGAATIILAVFVSLTNFSAEAETDFNGFGSLYAGRVIEGDEFLADYPNTGIYDRNWSISPDSILGMQFSSYFTDDFSLTAQVVVHADSNFAADTDWLYLNYLLTPKFSVQVGRKRLPLYYYSDYSDLGYAYYWVRPPPDLYTWQIASYNGINLLYEDNLAEWDVRVNVYYGNEESIDNKLLSLLRGVPVDEYWRDMAGIIGSMENEWLDIRLSYMQAKVDRDISGIRDIDNAIQHILGLSANFTVDELQVLSEYNQYTRHANSVSINTYMLSFAYQMGDVTSYITLSNFRQDRNAAGYDEKHQTTAVGARWDFYTDVAFKIQYDAVIDKGISVPIKGDSKSISLGLDFVF